MSNQSQLQDPPDDVHGAMWWIHKATRSRPFRELSRAEDRILRGSPTDSQMIQTDLWPSAISPPDLPHSEAAHTASRTPEVETRSPWTRSRDAPTMNENRTGTRGTPRLGTSRRPRRLRAQVLWGVHSDLPIYMSGYVFCPNSRVSAKLSKLPNFVRTWENNPRRPSGGPPRLWWMLRSVTHVSPWPIGTTRAGTLQDAGKILFTSDISIPTGHSSALGPWASWIHPPDAPDGRPSPMGPLENSSRSTERYSSPTAKSTFSPLTKTKAHPRKVLFAAGEEYLLTGQTWQGRTSSKGTLHRGRGMKLPGSALERSTTGPGMYRATWD